MKGRELVAVILLSSGMAFTTCGLMFMIVYGATAPLVFPALMLVGIVDGVTGLILTLPMLFSRGTEEPSRALSESARGRDGETVESAAREWRLRQTLIMAAGILSVLFLGVIGVLALYLHLILAWIKKCQFF